MNKMEINNELQRYPVVKDWPKISIVTPSFNQAQFLEETILSVVNQNYPNIEYIVIDGNSSDGSVEIIKKYAKHLAYWVSEPDKGLYDALQKGFALSTGEIMGWLNSDDMLHKKALFSIAELLCLNSVEWIQGQPTYYDENGRSVLVAGQERWCRLRYLMADYRWIQQESTYWTRSLWNKAGGYMATGYKYAGDLELWNRFFGHAKLYTPTCLIGGFRIRAKGQISVETMDRYILEAEAILDYNIVTDKEKQAIKAISKINSFLTLIQRSRIFNMAFVTSRLVRKKDVFYNFPAQISFSRDMQKFVI